MFMSTSRLLVLGALLYNSAVNADVRNNGGNCIGVKSCRPRCITFRVDRSLSGCGDAKGVFALQGDVNPWDIKRFQMQNCPATQNLKGIQLTIRIAEEGHSGSYFYTSVHLDESEDRFTFCSIYPCTKDECAVPEQMGFGLRFSIFPGAVGLDEAKIPLVQVNFFLKAAFVGEPLLVGEVNRYGPMYVEWMDDPTNCRPDFLSTSTEVVPPTNPFVLTNTTDLGDELYCTGDEYAPAPFPNTATPSTSPSLAPSITPVPSMTPSYSPQGAAQMEALVAFFNATEMYREDSYSINGWFASRDYCSFNGISCDERGYIIGLDLTTNRLRGTIPPEIAGLEFLRQLKLVNNRIQGTIPKALLKLGQLTQVELGSNFFTGTLPSGLFVLPHLRRLMVQYNQLEGTLSEELCQLTKLNSIDISGNSEMFGEIPSCVADLPLRVLRVDHVALVGTVPDGVCDVRNMNTLNPNTYGCAAIACPAGTYEPTFGRQYDDDSECMPCDYPSNVIGSSTCITVENNTIITQSPSKSLVPSYVPSASPSVNQSDYPSSIPTLVMTQGAPSWSPSGSIQPSNLPSELTVIPLPSNEPSLSDVPSLVLSTSPSSSIPSEVPSEMPTSNPTPEISSSPSANPSLTTVPSVSPSVKPSKAPTTSPSQKPSFAPSLSILPTRTHSDAPSSLPSGLVEVAVIDIEFTGVSTTLSLAEVTSFENSTKVYFSSENTTIESVTVVNQTIKTSNVNQTGVDAASSNQVRHLKQDGHDILVLTTSFEGQATEGMLAETITTQMEEDFGNYVQALDISVLLPSTDTPSSSPTVLVTTVATRNELVVESRGTGPNWWLLGAAVTLSLLAVLAVLFVRRSRMAHNRGTQTPYQDHGVSEDLRPADQKEDEDDILSAESSSGWNSTTSPGEYVASDAVSKWSRSDRQEDEQQSQDLYLMTGSVVSQSSPESLV